MCCHGDAHLVQKLPWDWVSGLLLDVTVTNGWNFHYVSRRTFTRKIGKDKDREQGNASTSQPQQLRSVSSGPTNAKAEKTRLAAQFGTPEVTTATGPWSAKDEKKALERKYQIEVVDPV